MLTVKTDAGTASTVKGIYATALQQQENIYKLPITTANARFPSFGQRNS